MKMEVPKKQVDYSFKMVGVSQILHESVTDRGIVYQIQLQTSDKPLKPQALKGLNPVFELVAPTGKYIYRVGLFHEYKDVLPHVNTVRKLGFRSAYIVAMVDGVEKPVATVRAIEQEMKNKPQYYKVVLALKEDMDSAAFALLRNHVGERDMAKVDSTLIVGPFANRDQAEDFVDFVEGMGYGQATLEMINND